VCLYRPLFHGAISLLQHRRIKRYHRFGGTCFPCLCTMKMEVAGSSEEGGCQLPVAGLDCVTYQNVVAIIIITVRVQKFFPMAQQPLVGQGVVVEASRSHLDVPQSVGLVWTSDQPDGDLYLTTHKHSQETNIHASRGIRTHDPRKHSVEGPRLRPRGHWDRRFHPSP
jgi:hypothetical protein